VPDIGRFDLSALRWILCGGAACPLSVIEYFTGLGRAFMEGFGMTELSPAALVLDAESVVPHAGSASRPFTHVGVRPVDEQGRDVALGVVGELVLRGPQCSPDTGGGRRRRPRRCGLAGSTPVTSGSPTPTVCSHWSTARRT
jgi:acyl-CoA synthetase (AMP-forming)/AMP-acid ligase II